MWQKQSGVGMNFVIGALLAASYVIFGKLSSLFGQVSSIVTIGIFLPEGIALAAALLFGRRIVWGIFLGQFLFALSNNLGFLPSLLIALINSIEALLAINVVEFWRIDLRLRNVADVLKFFALIAFVLQPFSAFAGNAVLALFGYLKGNFWHYVLSWYLGNVMAQFLITPLLIQLAFVLKKRALRWIPLLFIIALFGFFGYLLSDILYIQNIVLLFSLSLVALLAVDYYLGRLCAVVGLATLSLLLTAMIHFGIDVFAAKDIFEELINVNFFILAQVLILYIIDAMYYENRQLLQQLQEYNQSLQRRVQEEVAKNREKEKLLLHQSRLALIGETINMIAHQWRQPLNAIAIMVQTLALKQKRGSLDTQEFLMIEQKIMEQIDQMSATIDAFRNFFKPEEKQQRFGIQDVIERVISISEPQISKLGIDLKYKIDGEYSVQGYPNELGQALLNIISNAKDQLLECGGCAKKEIVIEVKGDEERVQILIADTGGGVKEEQIDKIFEPYVSGKGKNRTGLGLYITKMIVEEHMGGKIEVENRKDGAVFTIWLKRV